MTILVREHNGDGKADGKFYVTLDVFGPQKKTHSFTDLSKARTYAHSAAATISTLAVEQKRAYFTALEDHTERVAANEINATGFAHYAYKNGKKGIAFASGENEDGTPTGWNWKEVA